MILLLLMVSLVGSALADDDGTRVLFSFDKPDSAKQWQVVNDGVMGGRSDGRFKISDAKTMEFLGTLSLANNGGFASIRSLPSKLNLQAGDKLVARIRGDGRKYNLNLYVPRRSTAFSYRADFETKKDEWIEVEIPLDQFEATSFGQVVRNQPLNPNEVNGIGILLGDKKAGAFKLEVEWIKVVSKNGD